MGENRIRKSLIHKVWASNFDAEISKLEECLEFHTIVSIDTEFPGFIRNSPWGSIDETLYEDFRFNVNQTKLIQLGLTACDDSGKIGGSWEFNFSDFDPEIDAQSPSSASFLEQNGLDFNKLKKYGIPINLFTAKFVHIIRKHNVFRWVTFHGLYDIGYLIKAMGITEVLPETMEEFATVVVRRLGIVRDLKHMARFCEGLEDGKLGLERLGKLLDQKRYGLKHNAGSDSLLTASAHFEMIQRFDMDAEICDGYLYGFSNKLQSMDINMNMFHRKIITFGQIPYAIPLYCYVPSYITYYY
ncbi:putative CCR4-associated factor 1 homolog 8 [Benincasa hispida]|uniref:putative CCR4-associated factor 1 homolog 8 n=1 Tax=Benincasa hispida TaxID=102211 RepID=UPI0019007207|nr:putative CCR4-associated factor 1 homolog 8 [Benincasa hispida]